MHKEMQTDEFKLAIYTINNVKKTEQNDRYVLAGELDFHGVKKELSVDTNIPCMVFMCVMDRVNLHVKEKFEK